MKLLITALVSAFMMVSVPSFAASHKGGKMDKVDCTKKENAKDKACAEKKK